MPNEKRGRLFSRSPFITPERLKGDWAHVFDVAPQWAGNAELAYDEGFDENVVVALIGDAVPGIWRIPPVIFAILAEHSRFGNSVATNSNVKAGAGSDYLKLTYAGAEKDDTPVGRIVMDARRGEVVKSSADRHDLRPEELRVWRGGKASKDAREVLLHHAESAARKEMEAVFALASRYAKAPGTVTSSLPVRDNGPLLNDCPEDELKAETEFRQAISAAGGAEGFIAAYLENIRALFDLHDETYGLKKEI